MRGRVRRDGGKIRERWKIADPVTRSTGRRILAADSVIDDVIHGVAAEVIDYRHAADSAPFTRALEAKSMLQAWFGTTVDRILTSDVQFTPARMRDFGDSPKPAPCHEVAEVHRRANPVPDEGGATGGVFCRRVASVRRRTTLGASILLGWVRPNRPGYINLEKITERQAVGCRFESGPGYVQDGSSTKC